MRHSWKLGWQSDVNTLDVSATGFTFSGDKEIKRVDFSAIRSGYWLQTGAYGAGVGSLQLNGESGEILRLTCFQGWAGGEPTKFRAAIGDLLRALGAEKPQVEIAIGGSPGERLRTLAITVLATIAIFIFNSFDSKMDIGITIAVGVSAVAITVAVVYWMYGGVRSKKMTAHQLADMLSKSP